ncbi:hypothetical protein FNV43_RR06631 [Rhamnella rubrinervis]|uniref:Uncharacterized protein n=1 Tax=Rhamnella rubrinervis TaxID=2594499 RepID=A0A8K0MLK6_9ROSA|nr:hypothetical protein FNV43_RR06631 [Rhamnella rubrinervis]
MAAFEEGREVEESSNALRCEALSVIFVVRPDKTICWATSCTCIDPHLQRRAERGKSRCILRASTQSQPEGAHSQYLEGMINELRKDFANMRADFGLQLVQQGSDIRELKTMQIVAYTPPPPSPAPEQEPHYPIHVVLDPFKPVDKKKKAALSKFLKDRKSKLSTVDGFDKINKEVYNIFLVGGGG